jgi:hypothetical protein
MKLFGEYLIEKSIVSTEQMVAALVRQTSKMPGMAEIAYNKKLLRPDQIFKILKLQNLSNCGFIEAARELNIWNDTVSGKFEKALDEVRTPLVQVLVEMEAVKIETVTHALDEFLGDVQDQYQEAQNQPSPTVAETEAETDTEVETETEIIQDPSNLEQELNQIAETTLDSVASTPETGEYFSLFTEEKKIQIENHFIQLENGGISIPVMNAIHENLQSLASAARSAQVMMSASVLHGMVVMMDQILKTPATNMNEEFIGRIGKVNINAINFLWNLSVKIQTGAKEEDLLSEPETKKQYEAVAAAVEITRFDLDFLS